MEIVQKAQTILQHLNLPKRCTATVGKYFRSLNCFFGSSPRKHLSTTFPIQRYFLRSGPNGKNKTRRFGQIKLSACGIRQAAQSVIAAFLFCISLISSLFGST
jgi:hypothetical protein